MRKNDVRENESDEREIHKSYLFKVYFKTKNSKTLKIAWLFKKQFSVSKIENCSVKTNRFIWHCCIRTFLKNKVKENK